MNGKPEARENGLILVMIIIPVSLLFICSLTPETMLTNLSSVHVSGRKPKNKPHDETRKSEELQHLEIEHRFI